MKKHETNPFSPIPHERTDETLSTTLKGSIPWMAPEALTTLQYVARDLQSSQPWCNAGCTTGGFFAEMFPPSPTMFACFAGQVVKNVGPLPCQGGDGPGAMLQWSLVAAHSTKGLLDLDNMDFELHCYLDSTKMH